MSCIIWIVLFILFLLISIGLFIPLIIYIKRYNSCQNTSCPLTPLCPSCPACPVTPIINTNGTYYIYAFSNMLILPPSPEIGHNSGVVGQGTMINPSTMMLDPKGMNLLAFNAYKTADPLQQWRFVPITNNSYYIQNSGSGWYVAFGSTFDQYNNYATLTSDQTVAAVFTITLLPNGLYMFTVNGNYLILASQSSTNVVADITVVFANRLIDNSITENYTWLLEPNA